MKRIGVIADAHANLPATVAVLDALSDQACEAVVHLGDAIGIGPHPAEVLELLIQRDVIGLMGNHDELLALGLPEARPSWMSEEEAAHHRWAHAQLSEAHREVVRRWPYELELRLGAQDVALLHYARRPDGSFEHIVEPSASDLARIYGLTPGDVVMFGHDHRSYDLMFEERRFINPGSVGCHNRSEARAVVLTETPSGNVAVENLSVPYDDGELFVDFERRAVPAREFILREFMTRS